MVPHALMVAAALSIEGVAGYPAVLFRLFQHPVVWIGALIGVLDRRLNVAGGSRAAGTAALLLLLLAAGGTATAVVAATAALPWIARLVLIGALGSTLLAQRSLAVHVAAVARGLQIGLPAGREAVRHIVGRDPLSLDEAGVARAAIESLAENFADGVVAPAFWGLALGLPGMAMYKAVNTADSMIGHRTPRHERFGWASARFDDLVNLPASRLAAAWLVLAAATVPGADAGRAWAAVWRDANRHHSPNAGWPEAAMAGALGLRLAGPRQYDGVLVEDAWMGDGRADAAAPDIERALRVYRVACGLQIAAVALLASQL